MLPLVLAIPLAALASPSQSADPSTGPSTAQSINQATRQFAHPPVLLSTRASASPRSQDEGFYYFSIRLPVEAGRPLAAVTIDPLSRRSIAFDLSQTEAFVGEPTAQESLPLASVRLVENGDAVQITFARPIPPGTTLTVGLKPSQTPERRRYEFGVTAMPLADSADLTAADSTPAALGQPEFLGNGEISFRGERYRDYPFWWRNDGLLSSWSGGDRRVLFWDLPPEFDPRLRRRN